MAHNDSAVLKPQDHPRKFHEIFMLRAAEQGEGMQPKVRSARHLNGAGDEGLQKVFGI
jgi:hypothetical protein